MKQNAKVQAAVLGMAMLALMLMPGDVWASAGGVAGGAFAVLDNVRDALLAIAKPVAVIGIIVAGFTWGFSHSNEGMKTIGKVIVGMAIAIEAASIASYFGWGGAIF